jgi:hypothetical protein
MDMGFEVDPAAAVSSISILALCGALLLKISGLTRMRERRDSAAGNLREAKIALLTGSLDLESYERAATAAAASAQEYEVAKTIISVDGAQVQIGIPTDESLDSSASRLRAMNQTTEVTENLRPTKRNEVPQMTQSVPMRRAYDRRAEARGDEGSKSGNPSSLIGDIMLGFTLTPLLGLFAFSLTPDPVAQGRSAFDLNCDPCAQRQVQAQPTCGVNLSTAEKLMIFP